MKCYTVVVSLIVFVLISTINCADRAVWIAGENGIHPDHPGKCWSQTLNRELKVGEEATVNSNCELIKCGANFRFSRQV